MGVCWIHCVGQRQYRLAFRLSDLVVARVDGDPVEPGGEGRLGLEAIGLAENVDERLLNSIESGVPVAQHAQADTKDPVLMCCHQFVECRYVSVDKPGDEINVGGGSVRHSSRFLPVPAALSRQEAHRTDIRVVATVVSFGEIGQPQQPMAIGAARNANFVGALEDTSCEHLVPLLDTFRH